MLVCVYVLMVLVEVLVCRYLHNFVNRPVSICILGNSLGYLICIKFSPLLQAMEEMNGKELEGEEIEIVLAKPPDKKRKERQVQRQGPRNAG